MKQNRPKESLVRKQEKRLRQDPVLIVCEGKTEVNYIKTFMQSRNINHRYVCFENIKKDSSPRNLYRRARNRYREEQKLLVDYPGPPYKRVFCVFDKNSHETYEETIRLIERMQPAGVFKAITSVPCFEYWLVLHFEPNTGPYEGSGACQRLIKEKLHKHLPSYRKGIESTRTAQKLMDNLNIALVNSEKSSRAARSQNVDNPTTLMHELIKELQRII